MERRERTAPSYAGCSPVVSTNTFIAHIYLPARQATPRVRYGAKESGLISPSSEAALSPPGEKRPVGQHGRLVFSRPECATPHNVHGESTSVYKSTDSRTSELKRESAKLISGVLLFLSMLVVVFPPHLSCTIH